MHLNFIDAPRESWRKLEFRQTNKVHAEGRCSAEQAPVTRRRTANRVRTLLPEPIRKKGPHPICRPAARYRRLLRAASTLRMDLIRLSKFELAPRFAGCIDKIQMHSRRR